MSKKNSNAQPSGFTTEIDANTGEIIHTVTSKGEKEMQKMDSVFSFGFACASVEPIADTRVTSLAERFTFKSEDLAAIRAEQAAGHKVPQDAIVRAGHLATKDARLMDFWSPKKDDADAVTRRDAAHALLLQLLDPDAALTDRVKAQLIKPDGEVVTHAISFGPAESTTNFASVTHSEEGCRTLAHAIYLLNTCHAHWVEGRGVVFMRPNDADGKETKPIFVNGDEVYTLIPDGRGGTKFLPFTFPKTAWQLAALLATGHHIDVVMTDPSLYDAPVFRQRVVDGLVKEAFITLYGKYVYPYTRKEFIEARYPQDPIKGLVASPVASDAREVFEF